MTGVQTCALPSYAYLLNINTNDAYAGLRERRATKREKNAPVSGWELAETLTRYSERGRDRKSVESGQSVAVRVALWGGGFIKQKNKVDTTPERKRKINALIKTKNTI